MSILIGCAGIKGFGTIIILNSIANLILEAREDYTTLDIDETIILIYDVLIQLDIDFLKELGHFVRQFATVTIIDNDGRYYLSAW